ncbi:MAG: DUF4173 domain-containing protein [Pyrinomonadaceae bacterium]
MNDRTRFGTEILKVAMILGVLGDILLRVTPWGLNVLLFNAAFAAGMIMIIRRHAPEYLKRQTFALFGALMFFASMFVWRDSIELRIADTMAIVLILSVLFVPRLKIGASSAGIFQYFVAFIWSAGNAVFAPFVLLGSDIKWSTTSRTGWSQHLFSVLRGVAIATPILLIFGGLFIAADAVYEGMIQRVFNIRPEVAFTHILLTGIFAWLSAGYLRGVMFTGEKPVPVEQAAPAEDSSGDVSKVDQMRAEAVINTAALPDNLTILEHINISDAPESTEPPNIEDKKWDWAEIENTVMPPAFTLGTVEVGVILGLTNLLFLSFVIVQVPYLFGGMDLIQNTPDFKLAEYARRGFGELVAVSALVLPILLAGHWLIRKENPFTEKLFRLLAGIQIVLLFVIMASAVQRLVLLTGNLGYGLTTIRLYPLIFMTWLAIVFIWFGLTVLRGSRRYFAWGALWSAFLILGATHVLNPDAFIAKTNLELMRQGREFDAFYNAGLSDDALPVLMSSFADLKPTDQKIVVSRLAARYCEMRNEGDIRSWNLGRQKLWQMITSNQKLLSTLESCDGTLFHPTHYDVTE